jgi:hypothetical protein
MVLFNFLTTSLNEKGIYMHESFSVLVIKLNIRFKKHHPGGL